MAAKETSQAKLPPGTRGGRQRSRKALALVLGFTTVFLIVEVIGALVTGSLALMADAGHMLSDVAALGLALLAGWYSERPATSRRTYGHYRAEILAALVNGLTLILIVAYIFWEAYHRFSSPPEIRSAPMLIVASAGLGVNLLGAAILSRTRAYSLNVQGAFVHVVGDALGSIGAITAALVMLTTGWFLADPIISAIIGVVILFSAWNLIRRTVDVLMESAPEHVDLTRVREKMLSIPGVRDVHDLHVWTLTTGFVAMSGHVVMDPGGDGPVGQQQMLVTLSDRLKREFRINHTTVQIETEELKDEDVRCDGDPRCLP